MRSWYRRRRIAAAALALAVVVGVAAAAAFPLGSTGAQFNGQAANASTFASTSLVLPVATTTHLSASAGMVTVSWTASSAWVTNYQVQRSTSSTGPFTTVATITPAAAGFTEYAVPTAASQPGGITWGPDANLWFTEVAGNKIGKIAPSGTIVEFAVPTASSQPTDITTGA